MGFAFALFGGAQAAILDNSIALDAVYIPALSLTNAKPGDTAGADKARAAMQRLDAEWPALARGFAEGLVGRHARAGGGCAQDPGPGGQAPGREPQGHRRRRFRGRAHGAGGRADRPHEAAGGAGRGLFHGPPHSLSRTHGSAGARRYQHPAAGPDAGPSRRDGRSLCAGPRPVAQRRAEPAQIRRSTASTKRVWPSSTRAWPM